MQILVCGRSKEFQAEVIDDEQWHAGERGELALVCSFGFAKVYTSTMRVTACEPLYERVLPFYEAPGVPVGVILTDNGREFCGKIHLYELLLQLEDIEHRTTRSPRTNGFVERMNRTLLEQLLPRAGATDLVH